MQDASERSGESGRLRIGKTHSPRIEAVQGDAKVAVLPPGAVTIGDVRKAIDAALVEGDIGRARRLNALAGELEALGLATRKGQRGGQEG